MESFSIQLLVFGLFAAFANVFGGLMLFPSRTGKGYKRSLKYLLALGAGFMLAVTFFEIVPKTILLWQQTHGGVSDELYVPMVLLLAGYLLTQFFEHTIAPHFHLGEEIDSHEVIPKASVYSGLAGFLVHTFFDGVSIAAATQIDKQIGFLVFLAVLLHKFPEGFTIGSMVLAGGKGFREVMIATSLLGATTILGVAVFALVGMSFSPSVAYALPLASGVTLYVAASDLIPEVNHHGGGRPLVSLSIFAGVAFFFAMHLIVHEFMNH